MSAFQYHPPSTDAIETIPFMFVLLSEALVEGRERGQGPTSEKIAIIIVKEVCLFWL